MESAKKNWNDSAQAAMALKHADQKSQIQGGYDSAGNPKQNAVQK